MKAKARVRPSAQRLSLTMLQAIQHADEQGDQELVRHPGGFWSHAGWKGVRSGEVWFGATTVNALIDRGIFTVVEIKRGEAFTFPVRVRLAI